MRPDENIAFIAVVVWFTLTGAAIVAASYLVKLARWQARRDLARQQAARDAGAAWNETWTAGHEQAARK